MSEEIEEEIEACNVTCNDKECTAKCVYTVYEYTPFYGRYFEERKVKEVGKFKIKNDEDVIKESKKFTKEKGVYTTVDYKACRLLLDDEGDIVVSTCYNDTVKKHMPASRDINVEFKDENATIFVNMNKVEEWNKEYSDKRVEKYVSYHPVTLGIALLNYKYVTPKEVSYTCVTYHGEPTPNVKGITFEEYGDEPAINEAWVNVLVDKVVLNNEDVEDVVKEIIKTSLHEYAHYLDGLNMIKYEGGWWGERPLESLAVVITGKPIPSGRELSSEEFANITLNALERNYPEVLQYGVRSFEKHTGVEELKEKPIIKDVREFIKKFTNWLDERFGDAFGYDITPLDDGKIGLVLYPLGSDKYYEYLEKNFSEEYKKLRELGKKEEYGHEYYSLKESINVKAINKLFKEFIKEHEEFERLYELDVVKPSEYVSSSMLVSITYPAIEIDADELNWHCDPYETELPPPPEE